MGQHVTFKRPDGKDCSGFLVEPTVGGGAPGVVVIMHGPGLDRFVEDRVENLAKHGYAAIAPDLYHRQSTEQMDMMKRISQLTDPEIVQKLAGLGIVATPGPPEQLAQQIRTDLEKYGKVVKSAGIKAE